MKDQKRIKSVVTGILTQIQAKIGGIPWEVQLSSSMHHTMVVGIDFAHFEDNGYDLKAQ